MMIGAPHRRLGSTWFTRLGLAMACVSLFVVTACSSPAHHSGARRHAVSGKVTAEHGSTWTVAESDGQTATVTITAATRFGRSHQPSSAAQFPVGASVRVLGQAQGTTVIARRVLPPLATRVGETPTSTPGAAPPTRRSPTTVAPAARPPSPDPDQSATGALAAAVTAATSHAGVSTGIAVMDRTTGQVMSGTTGATGFESASVVKLFTIVDLLHRSETGSLSLTAQDNDDIGRALRLSDDNAMDDLWENDGGSSTVTDMAGLAHLQDTQAPGDPDEWGQTVISARDALAVYHYALTQLDPADQKTVTDGLGQAADTGADGFDQAFGLLQPPRPAGAMAKQGWMSDNEVYLHTTGVPVGGSRWVVAILTKAPFSTNWNTARATVDDATHVLTTALSGGAA